MVQEPQAAVKEKPKTSFNDITGTGGMTYNGRCYAPIDLEAKEGEESVEEGKVKITVPKEKEIGRASCRERV